LQGLFKRHDNVIIYVTYSPYDYGHLFNYYFGIYLIFGGQIDNILLSGNLFAAVFY